MSRENIVLMLPVPFINMLSVTFALREGGVAVYLYEMDDGAEIIAGRDPSAYTGVRIK